MSADRRVYCRPSEAAAVMGVCARTIVRWLDDQIIEGTRINGRVYIRRDSLAELAARRSLGAVPKMSIP